MPNCCTGAGIIISDIPASNNRNTGGVEHRAVILGTVLGVLLFIVSAVVVGIVLVFEYFKKSKKKQLKKIHLDIMAM